MGVDEAHGPSSPAAGSRLPASVRWLTLALATTGLLASTGAGWLRPGDDAQGLPLATVAALLLCLTAAGCLQLRFSYKEHVEAIDLVDAVLVPLIFFLAGPHVLVLVPLAVVGTDAFLRTRPAKALFNVAQWTAAAGVGALTFAALAEGTEVNGHNLGALALAMAVVATVNHLAMVAVLSLVTPGRMKAVWSQVSPLVRFGWILAGAVNLAFGLLMVAALDAGAWTVVLFAVPLGMLYWANRGFAESRADRARLDGLQRATHALVGPIDPRDAIGEFLAIVRECFAVEVAEVVLPENDGYRVQRLAAPEATGTRSWLAPPDAPSLAIHLLNLGETVRVTPAHPDEVLRARLREEAWRNCLASPLVMHGVAQGVLCVYNRTGLEGFEAGERAVLEALARELAGALEKAELVEEVLHQALHDSLTSLPNRTLFHQRVQRAITSANHTDNQVAVMLIDLNRFKEVNDTLGHHNGDLLLQDFSRRLQR
ncbi:MAG: diguanylate cyclase domain-containing protein, partial [Acidimicrobiales bacterium]